MYTYCLDRTFIRDTAKCDHPPAIYSPSFPLYDFTYPHTIILTHTHRTTVFPEPTCPSQQCARRVAVCSFINPSKQISAGILEHGSVANLMQARILSGNVANEKVSNAARDAIEMYKDMVKLEESVEQVSVMFQEMATLVELQAPLLDNILMNMEQAEEIVGKGMGELGKIKRINKKRWF